MKVSHQFTYLTLITLKKLISVLSIRSKHKLSIYLGKILFSFLKIRRRVAEENLKKAFPNWSAKKNNLILKKAYIFFSNNLINFISFPHSWKKIQFSVSGKKILENSFAGGKGIIMITGHFGSWEILGKWLGDYADLFVGIAFRQKNRGAHRFFIEQRELSNTKHIFKRESFDKMYNVLQQNGILGLVSDQDAGKRGVFVNFFNIPASTPKGVALFHINKKAPMVFATCVQTGPLKYRIEFIPILCKVKTLEHITQDYTRILESYIKRFPEQYFWFHRRWKTLKV
jgi:KDO2-lipid IV(A) lauroyltransferase